MTEETKLQSWDELKALRDAIRRDAAEKAGQPYIAVGMGTCGAAAGAGDVFEILRDELKKANRLQNVTLTTSGCYGFCYAEPVVEVRMPGQEGVRYGYVDAKAARAIVRQHVENGKPLEENIIRQEVRRP